MTGIKLIAGLGNPGAKYCRQRHNVGFWFVDALAHGAGMHWRAQPRLHGEVGQVSLDGHDVRLLKPSTFMNHSGRALAATLAYFRIPPEQCLVVHDDMDLDAGTVRLKFGGGHGGHNGLRDIIKALDTRAFHRVRLGIGHPSDRSRVLDWVLSPPSAGDENLILDGMARVDHVLPLVLAGDFNEAMKRLHTRTTP